MTGAHGGLSGVSLAMLGLGAVNAIYAFNGYGSAVLLGEEIQQARRHMGALVFSALAIAAVIEIGPVLAVVIGAPDLAALSASKSPISDFVRQAAGPFAGDVISLAVALAIFNSLIAVALMGGRQLYATARDGAWPPAVNRALMRLHPRFGSPWIATLAIGVIGCVCCFAPLKFLVVVLANGNVALYASLCAAVMIGRRNGATAKAVYRMPLFPLAPVGALIALIGVVWADLGDADTGRPGLLATVLVLVGGASYYWTQLRRSNRWAHREPEEESPVPI
jgi:amino acid transporter